MALQQSSMYRLLLAMLAVFIIVSSLLYSSYSNAYGEERFHVEHLRQRLREKEAQLMHVLSQGSKSVVSSKEIEKNPPEKNDQEKLDSALRGHGIDADEDDDVDDPSNMVVTYDNEDLRQVIYRYNTRYWLETKPEWPKDPIPPREKFVTFSPWRGGFNNIRMSLEMAVAFAVATNRTLVMPPVFRMYLRGKSDLSSYFDYEDLRRGVSVVTYDEFFDLVDFGKYQSERPTDSGSVHSTTERYYTGLRKMPGVHITKDTWSKNAIGGQIVYCFPTCPNKSDKDGVTDANEIQKLDNERNWFDEWARKLTKYDGNDPKLTEARIIHFPENLLGHFYTMIYYRDSQMQRRVRRIVRDHVHFREDIVEYAERIIRSLGDFKFSCLHIRRNEFQFEDAWTDQTTIIENTKRLFKKGEKIYISTDELSDEKERKRSWSDPKAMVTVAKHTWFEPMKEEWGRDKVFFLSDFYDDLLGQSVPDIYLGCIESLVCARARVFVGTRKSTFSGYIHRMRGYMHDVGQKLIMDAQTNFPYGYYNYFKGPEWVTLKHAYGGGHPYWGREYKDAWEGVYEALA